MAPTLLQNLSVDFNSIVAGDKAHLSKKVLFEDVQAFATLSGDYNPLHMDADFSRRTQFRRRVAHGMLVASYVSGLIGMHLPGPGALWVQQNFRWRAPVFVDDLLEISLVVAHKSEGTRTLAVKVKAVNQENTIVMEGDGLVMVLKMTLA